MGRSQCAAGSRLVESSRTRYVLHVAGRASVFLNTGRWIEFVSVGDTLHDLRLQGFTVVEGAVPDRLCDGVLDAMREAVGLEVYDPSTWGRVSAEIDQVPLWSSQAQWEVRQLPQLHALWSSIRGRSDLWASLNTCRFTPPWREGLADALAIHFDMDPHDQTQQWFPGIVALNDAGVGEGGFCCVPSLFADPQRWSHDWPTMPWGTEYRPVIDQAVDPIIEVPLRKGDLLIFDSHLPHGSVRNTSTRPRVVFNLELHPLGTDEELVERLADIEAGRCPPWFRWKPGHDRLDPQMLKLTALGERLLGSRSW